LHTNLTSIKKVARGLVDFESRHLQVAADVHVGIPIQIRAMREAKGWTQTDLAEKVDTTQNAISRLESSSYGKPNVKTLLRLAEAFDVALLVKFVPFSRFSKALAEMSEDSVVVPSFDEDRGIKELLIDTVDEHEGAQGSVEPLPVASETIIAYLRLKMVDGTCRAFDGEYRGLRGTTKPQIVHSDNVISFSSLQMPGAINA